MLLRRLLVLAVVAFASQAKADLLLEPYLGYEMDTFKYSAITGAEMKYGATGVALGARVGYAMPLLFFAFDYSMASLTTKVETGPAGSETPNINRSTLFALAGVKVPLFQAYAGYGFLNDWTVKYNGDDWIFKGSAIKVGGGFTGLPFVAINLDYTMSTFNKWKSSAGESDIAGGKLITEATASNVMLSVSAPFRL